MIIAIDFDGTICEEENYPHCGNPLPLAIDTILFLYNMGGNTLILNTLREDEFLNLAMSWLIDHKIAHCFSRINNNSEVEIFRYGNDPRKIAADMYIDDRAFGWSGWDDVRKYFCLD